MTTAGARRWWPLLPPGGRRPVSAAGIYSSTAQQRGGEGNAVRSGGERALCCGRVMAPGPALMVRWEAALGRRLARRGLSTSVTSLQYNPKQVASLESQKYFYFDTHAVVQHLEECGFSTNQSEVVVATLLRIMNSNMEITHKDMATKIQQEMMLQHIMSHIAAVKKDMIILEKSEFSALRAANEKLKIELNQLKKQLALTEHEKRVLETRSDIVELNSLQGRAVTQANQKIDTEVAGLKTLLESHKLDTIKYLAGSVFTCLTIVLGFYRLWV
ncbi:mitochondrial calcium uniporter regulator 1 isoform X2 [Leucoraja erinacea]|uniref:mitochondrial calcium uniporter regulator 1 isoform X2 n=1 Tax=Leucoraja erinaceus TaxID=7782 RepID=UPI0024564578|nr:mitochondrial calcium uniporter regulator 1 isoform X2 [Leucoraja erinacea]